MADNRQRGQVAVATELQQRGSGGGMSGGGTLIDNGMSQPFEVLSRELEQVGKKVGAWADHAAQKEGEFEGRIAGMDPEFRPSRSLTIRGEAFDRAGLQVMETRVRQEIGNDFAAAFDKHAGDPKKLAAVLDQKGRAWLDQVPTELKPDVANLVRGQTLTHNRAAARAELARVTAEHKAALADDLQTGLNALHQQAYKLGLDGAADEVLADGMSRLERTLGRKGVDGKPLVTPAEARRIIKSSREEVAHARIYGAFDRAPLDAKQQMLASWRDDFANSRGLAAEMGYQGFAKVERHLEAALRQAQAESNAVGRLFQQDVKKLQGIAEKGFVPKPADVARLEGIAAGNPEMGAAVSKLRETVDFVGAMRPRRPEEMDRWIKGERARIDKLGASTEEVHRLEVIENLAANARSEIAKDPIGWAKTVGFNVPDLDLRSPETVAASIGERAARADEVAQYYGITPQFLRPDEAKLLGAKMAEGGDGMIAVATAIAAGAPGKVSAIMSELAKHGGPATAFVGSLLVAPGANATKVATDAANGLAMRKLDGFKSRVPDAKARVALDEEIGTALNSAPENRQALAVVAAAAYEVRALKGPSTDFDADVYKQIVREALGEHKVGGVTYGGISKQDAARPWWAASTPPVIVPPFVRQDGFKQVIDSVKITDLIDPMGNRPLDAKGRDINEATLRRARAVPYGSGRYLLSLGDDPEDPQYVGGGKGPGGAFVLDLNRLRPILAKRRPDLVLGGR